MKRGALFRAVEEVVVGIEEETKGGRMNKVRFGRVIAIARTGDSRVVVLGGKVIVGFVDQV